MKRIGELLLENNIITKEELDSALERQKELPVKKPVGEILVEMKVVTIDSLIKYLEIQLREKFRM
jgi:type IV pilus assembly protein PilB